jgi:uncharacterized phage protein gp47/JayE
MILPLQNFASLLETMSAGLQGGAAQLVDVSVGSVMRALLEASASMALWMQWLVLQVLGTTRAATSSGSDLDSWMADFGLVRLPGAPSGGAVTFGRYTVGIAAHIPVGSLVKTTDGSLTFSVTQDATNPAWDQVSGYVLAAAAESVVLPVQASAAGSAGNVLSGAIGLLSSALPGVDFVTNTLPLGGGVDAESDLALRNRFRLYINSRSLATRGAVGAAIQSLRQGLRYAVLENVNLAGQAVSGNFCVFVDDGSSSPSDALLAEVSEAVEAVRPLGSTYSVTGPFVIPVTVQMSLVTSQVGTDPALGVQVQQAVIAWITALPMGGVLALSKLEAIAHAASDSVISVATALINGSGADVQAGDGGVIIATSVNVAVS